MNFYCNMRMLKLRILSYLVCFSFFSLIVCMLLCLSIFLFDVCLAAMWRNKVDQNRLETLPTRGQHATRPVHFRPRITRTDVLVQIASAQSSRRSRARNTPTDRSVTMTQSRQIAWRMTSESSSWWRLVTTLSQQLQQQQHVSRCHGVD